MVGRSVPLTLSVLLFAGALGARAGKIVAGTATVTDGDTLIMDGTRYRFNGIDAPEKDQPCLDDKGARYPCGLKAREALEALIAGRSVHCEDLGPDKSRRRRKNQKTRRIGQCSVPDAKPPVDLNRRMVCDGWAVNFEPYAKGRFKPCEEEARANGKGMWPGCFVAPREHRRGHKRTAVLLGAKCGNDARGKLFDDPSMPPGCAIKGKFRLLSLYRGIYHLQDAGCASYSTTKPDRWFCSEEEAQDAGFRKALNCRK